MKLWPIFVHCKCRYARLYACCLFLVLLKTTFPSFASSYGPVYPYTQKTENGKVKIHAIPYGVHDGPYGLGETFVYSGGKLLYSIDKYFTNTVFSYGNGEFLIEIDFWPRFTKGRSVREFNGTITTPPRTYDGNAAYIYKKGKLFKTIAFKDLKIDTATLRVAKYDDDFAWWHLPDYMTKDPLKIAMDEHLAYLENGKLFLISSDNQLISIDIESGEINNTPDAYQVLKGKTTWTNSFAKRRYHKRRYGDNFYLPRLEGGKSIELSLAAFLQKKPQYEL